jgi:methylthioribose-1-phosphate isomerase
VTSLDLSGLRPSITWIDDHLEVIDQTLLPGVLQVRQLRTVEDVVDAIRRLVVRGAPAIGCCGALGMVVGLDQAGPVDADAARVVLAELEHRIGSARPTAVNLPWALARVRKAAEVGTDPGDIRRRACEEALAILSEDREACRRIGEQGRRELAGVVRLLTHCNTGRLATAGWGTALGVVYAKAAHGEPVEVFATETRPLLQGARLTVWELKEAGIPVTLLGDSAAGSLLADGRVEAVIVGADRIAGNGDVANKVGTYPLALAAREAGIPFYVAAPFATVDLATASGRDIVIEERDASEVLTWLGVAAFPEGVPVWNPAFDVTPQRLITALITDRGVVRPPFAESIRAVAGRS